MKENFIHCLSNTPCTLTINGEYVGKIDNESNYEIDLITKTNNIFVNYSPISTREKFLPYTFLLNTSSTPTTDNEYIKIVPFPNNNYDVIMEPFFYYQIKNSQIILNENVGKHLVSIVNDNISRISIYNGISLVLTINTQLLLEAKVEQKNDLIIIIGVVSSDTYYLVVIDAINYNILHNDISHSIESDNEGIKSLKKLGNISNYAEVTNINLKTKEIEKYNVYTSEQVNITSTLLLPKVFLESVSIQDENSIKKYLCENYHTTSITDFVSYFGNIKEMYLNRHEYRQNKVNYTILTDSYKNYNFIINNDKIEDIEEIF